MSDSGKVRFPTAGIFRTSLNRVNSKMMPSCMHSERAEKDKVHETNCVYLIRAVRDKRCTFSKFRWVQYAQLIDHFKLLSLSDASLLSLGAWSSGTRYGSKWYGSTAAMFSMFVSRQGENSMTSRKILRRVQDGGVITRFSSKDFIRLGNALEAERSMSILPLH